MGVSSSGVLGRKYSQHGIWYIVGGQGTQEMVVDFFFFFLSFFFWFLELCLCPMEVSRLGGRIEAVAAVYTTAPATQDPSHICDLHHSSLQRWILNPLSKAKDQTCILMDTS